MLLIFGTRSYGRVDRVDGMFHVETSFFHVWFVPLIPTGSFAIPAKGGGEVAVPIGLSIKSVAVAWLRLALVVSCLTFLPLGACGTLAAISESPSKERVPPPHPLVALGMLAIPIALFLASRSSWANHPTYPRAKELLEAIGGNPEAHLLLDFSYGQISEDHAEEQFAVIQEQRAAVAARAPKRPTSAGTAARKASAPTTAAQVVCPSCGHTVRRTPRCVKCGEPL